MAKTEKASEIKEGTWYTPCCLHDLTVARSDGEVSDGDITYMNYRHWPSAKAALEELLKEETEESASVWLAYILERRTRPPVFP